MLGIQASGGSGRRLWAATATVIGCVCFWGAVAPSSALADGSIAGTVTGSDTHEPLAGICVFAGTFSVFDFASDVTDANGEYELTGLTPASDYHVTFAFAAAFGGGCSASTTYAGEAYDNQPDFNSGDNVAVTDGQTTQPIDAELDPTHFIRGTVTNEATAAPVANVCVLALNADGTPAGTLAFTDGSGQYAISINPGQYTVGFLPCDNADLAGEFYNDKRDFDAASPVTVPSSGDATGIDAALEPAAHISGTVTDEASAPVAGICVRGVDPQHQNVNFLQTTTDSNGNYDLGHLPASDYKIQFDTGTGCGSSGLVGEFYDNKANFAGADTVTVTEGQHRTGFNAVLGSGSSISGTVTDDVTGDPIVGACVSFSPYSGPGTFYSATTNASGVYTKTGMDPGTYSAYFSDCGGTHFGEYYDDAINFSDRDPITLGADQHLTGVNAASPRPARSAATSRGRGVRTWRTSASTRWTKTEATTVAPPPTPTAITRSAASSRAPTTSASRPAAAATT